MKKEYIKFDEFLEIESKLEIRYGTITVVEKIPKSKKLLKLTVFFGSEIRTVVTNIGDKLVSPESLQSVKLPFIMNLEPVTIMGVESTAMIMVPHNDAGEFIFGFIPDGTKLL